VSHEQAERFAAADVGALHAAAGSKRAATDHMTKLDYW
jgi:hypothetical protein